MPFDRDLLAAAIAALATYDWGDDGRVLKSLDEAVIAAHDDPVLRTALEGSLTTILAGAGSRAAKDHACRRLALVGGADCVPHLAALLDDPALSHPARQALERIEDAAAAVALRGALATAAGGRRIGVIASLAARGDADAVPLLAGMLTAEAPLAAAAARALGRLALPAAAAALATAPEGAAAEVRAAVVDARLACADAMLRRGDREAARRIYDAIAMAVGETPVSHRDRAVRIAARRGMLACLDEAAAG
ncbi:MAG: hypothetical protein ACKOCW_11985 [Planctomycetaceae bacterium]